MITWRARTYKPRESTHQSHTGHHWVSRERAGALYERSFLIDSTALVAGLFGVAIGVAGWNRVTKRDRWTLNGVLSIGAACLLGVVTEGNQSREEHNIVFAVTMALLL